MSAARPVILGASPRMSGNSDYTVGMLQQACYDNGYTPETLWLREYSIQPCVGCDACTAIVDSFPGTSFSCPLERHDDGYFLLQSLVSASVLYIVSPIYMYHVPAQLKALLDRLQPFWHLQGHSPAAALLQPRKAFGVLIAGRTKGETLFTGALRSLRWSLAPLAFTVEPFLELRGLDARADIHAAHTAQEQIDKYARASLGSLRG